MDHRILLDRLISRGDLSTEEAEALMSAAVSGQYSEVQLSGLLVSLQSKGVSGPELACFARILRSHAVLIGPVDGVVDTCGTGGGIPSFNLSTAAAIVASAAGAKVAKHGNRAVTSACGSADVLESLGVRLELEPEKAIHVLETVGIVFLFAQRHHPAWKQFGAVRKELGVRTVFNLLGPLANPAQARFQILGVYDRAFITPMAEALCELGAHRALVVRGTDGLDEISPCVPTEAALVEDGNISYLNLDVSHHGGKYVDPAALLPGATVEESAAILRESISDPNSARSQAVIPSAGAALWICGQAATWAEGMESAAQAIASGEARRRLEQLIEVTQSA
jgi:anthranilate phosphoribosyltransferase